MKTYRLGFTQRCWRTRAKMSGFTQHWLRSSAPVPALRGKLSSVEFPRTPGRCPTRRYSVGWGQSRLQPEPTQLPRAAPRRGAARLLPTHSREGGRCQAARFRGLSPLESTRQKHPLSVATPKLIKSLMGPRYGWVLPRSPPADFTIAREWKIAWSLQAGTNTPLNTSNHGEEECKNCDASGCGNRFPAGQRMHLADLETSEGKTQQHVRIVRRRTPTANSAH